MHSYPFVYPKPFHPNQQGTIDIKCWASKYWGSLGQKRVGTCLIMFLLLLIHPEPFDQKPDGSPRYQMFGFKVLGIPIGQKKDSNNMFQYFPTNLILNRLTKHIIIWDPQVPSMPHQSTGVPQGKKDIGMFQTISYPFGSLALPVGPCRYQACCFKVQLSPRVTRP